MPSDDEAPRCLLIAPNTCKDNPKIAPRLPKMHQDNPIMAQDNSKFAASSFQILPRTPQDGLRVVFVLLLERSLDEHAWNTAYNFITGVGTWQYNVFIDLLHLFVPIVCNMLHANALVIALNQMKDTTMSCLYECVNVCITDKRRVDGARSSQVCCIRRRRQTTQKL